MPVSVIDFVGQKIYFAGTMKHLYLYFLIACIAISCKKDHPVEEAASTYIPDLKIQQIVNDSTIVLKWPKYTGKNFGRYWLKRSATYVKNGSFDTFDEGIDSSTNVNDTVFTETRMPSARQIIYRIYVGDPQDGALATAFVVYQRPPYTSFYGTIRDVLFDRENKRLYIIHSQQYDLVTAVDYTSGRQVNSINLQGSLSSGYCALGDFNGNKELYIPIYSSLLILNASSLEVKDRINCGGSFIGSVVSANGNLYVSTNDTTGGTSECIKVYGRATKNLIGRTGFHDNTRLLFLEGTSTEMVDITSTTGPTGQISYYQFSAAGVPLSKKQDNSNSGYSASTVVARSFPDGNRFITSYSGTIFNKSLAFEKYLKQNGSYADYAFSDDGSVIYAADVYQKKIDVINYPAGNVVKSYPTSMYPFRIFRDGNTLICLSITATEWYQSSYCFVERINL